MRNSWEILNFSQKSTQIASDKHVVVTTDPRKIFPHQGWTCRDNEATNDGKGDLYTKNSNCFLQSNWVKSPVCPYSAFLFQAQRHWASSFTGLVIHQWCECGSSPSIKPQWNQHYLLSPRVTRKLWLDCSTKTSLGVMGSECIFGIKIIIFTEQSLVF